MRKNEDLKSTINESHYRIVPFLTLLILILLGSLSLSVSHAETEYFYATNDAHVWEELPDYNGGEDSSLAVGRSSTSGGPYIRSYIGFGNIFDEIPSNAEIDSAELRLYRNSSSGSFTMGVKAVIDNWFETGSFGITWNNQPSVYSSPSTTVNPTGSSPGNVTVDVTQHVRKWVELGYVRGLQLYASSGETQGENVFFDTRSHSSSSHRPRLQVNYSVPKPDLGNDATITEFSPPVGPKDRGAQVTATVKVKNTGSTTRSFWIGLSFAHESATWDSWPNKWYDIKPIQTSILQPNAVEDITFSFLIPDNLRPGQYYAVSKIWQGFDSDAYKMVEPLIFDSSKVWSGPNGTGQTSFSLGDYEVSKDTALDWISYLARFIVFDDPNLEANYRDSAIKPLFYIEAGAGGSLSVIGGPPVPVEATGSFLIDLADLFQVTPEGKELTVTIWVDVSAKLKSDPKFSLIADAGIITHNFSDAGWALADDRGELKAGVSGAIPGFAISLIELSSEGGLQKPLFDWTGNWGLSLTVEGSAEGLISYEIDLDNMQQVFNGARTDSLLNWTTDVAQGIRNLIFQQITLDDGSWQLYDGVWQTGLKLGKTWDQNPGVAHYYYFDIPSGTSELRIITSDGTGDADLYVRYGDLPTTSVYDELSVSVGNNENVTLPNPTSGRWHIMLPASSAYDGVNIVAYLNNVEPPDILMQGRLAAHSYTEYDDDNNDGYHSIDGEIIVFDLATGTHYVQAEQTISNAVIHAMNPRFSVDGSQLIFMGLPANNNYSHTNDLWANYLDVFLYDFRTDTVTNLSAQADLSGYGKVEEDPDFSPDGLTVIFKRDRSDLWMININTFELTRVTFTTGLEESGPRYSPDAQWIAYWISNDSDAEIVRQPVSGGEVEILISNIGIQDMYPAYLSNDQILFARWTSTAEHDDQIYVYNIANSSSTSAAFNIAGSVDDSDPFPIQQDVVGFSSNRSGKGGWDLFLGDINTGAIQWLEAASTSGQDLGGCYTPHVVNFESIPEIFVSPSNQDFGTVLVGSEQDMTFTVANIGHEILSGNANVSAPFSIVSGESYSLIHGQTQTVKVRFIPTNTGVFNENVTFTGGGGTIKSVVGEGVITVIAPIIDSIANQSTSEGSQYTGPIPTVTGTQPITWSLIVYPSGMSINSQTGVINWTNATTTGSPHTITIRATNTAGYDDKTWQLTVYVNVPPTLNITSPLDDLPPVSNSTTSYDFLGIVSDSDGTVTNVEYSLRSGAWQTASGTTNWNFTVDLEVGDNLVEVRAQDNDDAYSNIESRTITRLNNGSIPSNLSSQILSVSSGEYAIHPRYSPDGTKISYGMYSSTGGFDIWVMNSDGSGAPQRILNDVFPADWMDDYYIALKSSWSPDGQKIAYVKGEGDGQSEIVDIWTINSDGSGIPLQITTAGNAIMPSWSPDGKKIAYVSIGGDINGRIWLMNSDGTGTPKQITNSGLCVYTSWSPDGRQLAYISYNAETESSDLWVVNSDGTEEPSRIVSDVFLAPSINDYVVVAKTSWSPDGAKICYTSDGGVQGNFEIWVTNSDGSNTPEPILRNGGVDARLLWPAWSPNGTKIVYSNFRPGEYSDLYITDYFYMDDAFPAANIVSPILNQQISGIADVIGTVTDNISVDGTTILSSLSSWTLEYGEGKEPESWTNIITSTTHKFNELLWAWDTSVLSSGKYTLRLKATDGVHENVQSVSVLIGE